MRGEKHKERERGGRGGRKNRRDDKIVDTQKKKKYDDGTSAASNALTNFTCFIITLKAFHIPLIKIETKHDNHFVFVAKN